MRRGRTALLAAAALAGAAAPARAQAARPAGGRTTVFLPTSAALGIARDVASAQGYPVAERSRYFFDVLQAEGGAPLYPGFVSVEFVWEGRHVTTVSIHERTFQALDMTACLVYDYPALRPERERAAKATGVRPLTLAELRDVSDCGPRLRVLTAPERSRPARAVRGSRRARRPAA